MDEGDTGLDSTVLIDYNITDCDAIDDQEIDERHQIRSLGDRWFLTYCGAMLVSLS